MPARQASLMKALGPKINAPGQLERDAILVSLTTSNKALLLSALSQVALAGERAAELLLSEPVSKIMAHQDPEVCAAAVKAMGAMGLAAARFSDDIAEYLLKHPDVACRSAALGALGKMGPGLSISSREAVGDCLSDQSPQVRQAALRALAAMGETRHAEEVKALLSDPSQGVRAAAVETLGQLMSMSQEVQSLCPETTLAEPMSELLASSRTRYSAIVALRYMADKAPANCVGAVVDALTSKDCATRQEAATALGGMAELVMQSPQEVDKLKGLLKSSETGVRAAAAYAVGCMGTKAASLADTVAELLSDDAEDSSALALQMGTCSKRPSVQLRIPKCAAMVALGRVKAAEQMGSVAASLPDENWEIRMSACEGLGACGKMAKQELASLTPVLEDDAYPVRAMACYAMGEMKSTEALSSFIERFTDPAHSVRLYAVMAVGQLGEQAEEYCHDVFKLLNDPVSHVRAAATIALSKLGETGQNYAGVVAGMLYEEDAEIRRSALQALGSMGRRGGALVEDIAELMHGDPIPAVRQAAAAALSSLGATGALETEGLAALEDAGVGYDYEGEMGGEEQFEGQGQHYADIQDKKKQLQSSGKWIEGIF